MPTSPSSSTARAHASRRETGRCRRTASAIWPPTVKTGLSAVLGSWKTIANPAPRAGPVRRGDVDDVREPVAIVVEGGVQDGPAVARLLRAARDGHLAREPDRLLAVLERDRQPVLTVPGGDDGRAPDRRARRRHAE